jgi:O-antigen ligase/polysaccharide polymerase Wzy-like membrane protein
VARAFETATGSTTLQAPVGQRRAAGPVHSFPRPASLLQPRQFRWFTPALALLLCGYLFFNKPFAYLHVPGTPVFVGEIVLAIGIAEVLQVRSPWYHLLQTSPVLRALLAFMALCAVRLGVDLPRYHIDAVRDSSIWYYGLLAFLVAAAAVREPTFVPRLLRWYRRVLPWFFVWAPVTVALSQIDSLASISVPGTSTPINAFRPNDYAVHIGIGLAFLWLGIDRLVGARPARSGVALISVVGLLALLVAGSQSRGGFLSAVAALTITLVFLPSGRRRRIALSCTCGLLVVLALAMTLNLRIEGERRDISVQQLTANLASLTGDASDEDLTGTVEWREGFWTQVLNDLLSSKAWLTGLGFGEILPERYEVDVGNTNRGPDAQPLRSVHNSHLTILARVGFPGFALWLLLWLTWTTQLLRRIRRRPGGVRDPATALVVWLLAAVPAVLIGAYFDPSLEGPHVGIWLFAMVGFGAAATRVPQRIPVPTVPAPAGAGIPSRLLLLLPPAAAMARAGDLAKRRGWELADLALWNLLTLAVGLQVARSVGVKELGAFSIAFAVYLLVLAASRALATAPLPAWHGGGDVGAWRWAVTSATGTAVVVGAVAGAGSILASLPLSGSTGAALFGLGLTLPGLLLQDSWRSTFLAAGRGAQALANDLIWALALLAAVAVATITGHISVGWVTMAWGGSATLAAVAGAVQARLVPRVTWVFDWVRPHREVAARSFTDSLSLGGGSQLRLGGLAAISGLAAAGALWAAELLLVPPTAVVVAIVTILAPAASDLGRWSPRRLGRFCLQLGGLAAGGAFAWGAALLALPDTVGVRLLGSSWLPASQLLAPVTIAVAGFGFAAGAWVGRRAGELEATAADRRGQVAGCAVYLAAALGGAALAGAAGAAWGSAAGTLAGAGIWWWQMRQRIREAEAAGR